MKKIDALISFIVGLLVGLFFFGALQVLKQETGFSLPISQTWLLIVLFPFLALLGMFLVSLIGQRILIIYQAAKFALVGATNSFIDWGVTYFFILFSGIAAGPFFSLFKGVGFLLASIWSYVFNKYWTFSSAEKKPDPKEYSKFLMTVTIGFGLNVGIASLVVNVIGPQFGLSEFFWSGVGMLTATCFAWVWNFLGSKFIVFKK